jgi:alpha-amylase/alpha-mannosidase (GH57 family)
MAVDEETLRLLVEAGIEYTILAGQQVRKPETLDGAGPYRVKLSGGGSLSVFVRDDALSSEISFNIHNLGGAGYWARNTLGHHRKDSAPLMLLATEGETFGHHYAGEDQFLHWLVAHEAPAIGFRVATLDAYLAAHPPKQSIELYMPSSWSDQRGLASWATGQAQQGADTTWKGALRRALDNAASELDRSYEELCGRLAVDPWTLRDQYAPVLFDAVSADEFVRAQIKDISTEDVGRIKTLLTSQELAQRMYNSYTFTNDKLDSRQPRYAIACAAAALAMAQDATGVDLSERLRSDLAVVMSVNGEVSGSDLLDHVLQKYDLQLEA